MDNNKHIQTNDIIQTFENDEPVGQVFVEAGEYNEQKGRFKDECFADIYDVNGTEVVDLKDESREAVYLEHGNPVTGGGFEVEGNARVHRANGRSFTILSNAKI